MSWNMKTFALVCLTIKSHRPCLQKHCCRVLMASMRDRMKISSTFA